MSHFTTVATKITNIQCLLKALDALKWKYTHAEEGVTVRGWRGQTSLAEVSINMSRYDIGVVKTKTAPMACRPTGGASRPRSARPSRKWSTRSIKPMHIK